MKKALTLFVATILAVGCASKHTTSEQAQEKLDAKFLDRVGKARKAELIEYFGNPEWCRTPEGSIVETCRFYKKTGTAWVGEKRDRKSYLQYDEVIAEFNTDGVLQKITTNAQR